VPQDAECFICKTSINSMPRSSEGIVRGCACRGTMGLAHLSCLVRQAETAANEYEDQGTGEGMKKWDRCFDCGQNFHGAVFHALAWAMWKTYLGRPEADPYRALSMGVLGGTLRNSRRLEEALPVLEAYLAITQRYGLEATGAQTNLANCLGDLGRHDEALVLCREIYARRVASFGVSDVDTIMSSLNMTSSMLKIKRWDDATTLLRDQLLPVARRSLGSDHDLTLALRQNLADALSYNRERTRDDLLEAETILQDVVQRRRRVFGPAHPETLRCEHGLAFIAASRAR